MREFILPTWLEQCSVDHIVSILTDAFGHISDHREMSRFALKAGAFGVEGVLSDVVWPLLDQCDEAHPNYAQVRVILEEFCSELATKLDLYREVSLAFPVLSTVTRTDAWPFH